MIRVRKSHIALPRPPAALAICAMVFSRRRGGITSVLRRFDEESASFCCDSNQYNSYIATATDNISHSLFAHETSTMSSMLLGAGRQESNCESLDNDGNDKGAVTETKDIKIPKKECEHTYPRHHPREIIHFHL